MVGTSRPIVVGYDGSQGSKQALNWALRAAKRRGRPLTICHAWVPACPMPLDSGADVELSRRAGGRVLAEAGRYLRALAGPAQAIRLELAAGPAALALCEYSAEAEMVVVGARGRGTLPGLPVGSVSMQVAAHGHGRVIVVRGHWWPPGGFAPGAILVGADGSAGSDAAVSFAFEEARLRGARLLAMCAWPGRAGASRSLAGVVEDFDQQLARAGKEHPDVDVSKLVTGGPAEDALLAAAVHAQLLVVGPRHGDGAPTTRLGSLARAVLRHASCPVGVIRPRDCGP
jgi:nucleotide-binding universal stress UspA family protein